MSAEDNNKKDDKPSTTPPESTNPAAAALAQAIMGSAANGGTPKTPEEEADQIKDILELLRQQHIMSNPSNQGKTAANLIPDDLDLSKLGDDGTEKKHAFWDTQPMFLDKATDDESELTLHAPLIPNKEKSELRQEPYNMPKGFVWSDLNIADETELEQIYDLLAKNYVEDGDCMFRFDYSMAFLKWALSPPNYQTNYHLGVRSSKTQKLVAFISAIPANIRSCDNTFPSVEINFLCVHKKLRSKRLAPVLIKEITRRVNHNKVFQALYTAGVVLPGPVSTCRYYHRTLNPKKLVDIGFTHIPPRMTMARMMKLYKLAPTTSTPTLTKLTTDHVESAHALLMNHLSKFKLATMFDVDDFKHWFLPRDRVITTYVACNDKNDPKKVTDMISYYHLHSTIIGHQKHDHLYAAYSYYNIATTVELNDLMRDALIIAKNEGMDVFNALEQMHNDTFLEALKFGKGDGNLQYYLYNWCCPTLDPKDVGIVLL